jgi:hypothetical protein
MAALCALVVAVCSACATTVPGHPSAAGPPAQRSFAGVAVCSVFPPSTLAELGLQHTAEDDAEKAARDAYSQSQLPPGRTLTDDPNCLFSLRSGATKENRVSVTFSGGKTFDVSRASSRRFAATLPSKISMVEMRQVSGYDAYGVHLEIGTPRCTVYLGVAEKAQLVVSAAEPSTECLLARRITRRAVATLPFA